MNLIMHDSATPDERVNPQESRFLKWCGEIWLRYQYRIACWELDKQAKHSAEWMWVKMVSADKLKLMGIDPELQPEPLLKHLEVWLYVVIFSLVGLIIIEIVSIRDILVGFIQGRM